jgi:hypothetical protein
MADIYYLFGIPLIVYIVLLHIKLYQAGKAPPVPPPQPSQELSEFLNDLKTGYSFVRVSPADVIIRSPRD